jgi:hypothetical protein
VTSISINRLLDQLDEAKPDFSPRGQTVIERTLRRLVRSRFDDPEALVRYHEALLFLRAYPQNSKLLSLSESALRSFADRVQRLGEFGVDLATLEHPEISGIAGTSVSDTFGYHITRWLVHRQQGKVALDEDWVEDESRLAPTLPRFIPLLEEDAMVEANVPYLKWIRTAKGAGKNELEWLIERFESLDKSRAEQAELYDSLRLYVRWRPPYRATRTGMRLPVRKLFFHQGPLIRRKDVSLPEELRKPPLPVERLSRSEGQKILDLARETSTLRYRELWGFTHGDEARVSKIVLGRGVNLFVMGVPPEWRLPLRAYHAAMIFKNGIPVGYFEGLSIFERMESGFNLYYTFRDGETAWLYAQILRVSRQLLGVTTFTLDPYQIGHENEEGIESGAFWFYRKLGFRPTRKELLELTQLEEKKLATRTGYRTTAGTLRKLAAGYMIYELEPRKDANWDDFQVRNLGLAVQRKMAREFGGDPDKIRTRAIADVANALNLDVAGLKDAESKALLQLSLVLSLISNLKEWSTAEKELLVKIIIAKSGADETRCLRLMQRHSHLRQEMIRLGSSRS